MKKYKALPLLLLFIGCSIQHGFTQAVGKRISHTTLQLFNNSDKDLNVLLGVDSLITYRLYKMEKWISPTYPLHSRPKIIIKTNEKESRYKLRLNSAYMVYWNANKQRWDVKKVNVVNN